MQLLTEVCNDVRVEPVLQTLTGELFTGRSTNTTDGARLDIAANGFWGGRSEKCFFDVRVFNPHAPSNSQIPLERCFKKHEMEKRRNYSQRIQDVEHASFTPLVLSASGGFAKEATVFYKRLASMLAEKWDKPYSTTLNWLRCQLSFSLLRSAIQCLPGARSSRGHAIKSTASVDLITAEVNISI